MANGTLDFSTVMAAVDREFPIEGGGAEPVVDAAFPAGQTVSLGSAPAGSQAPEVLSNDKLNLPVARAKFDVYSPDGSRILKDAKALEVNSDETVSFAVALAGEAKKITKAIELRQKTVTEEAENFVKTIKGLAKSLCTPLAEAERILKEKIQSHNTRKELARRKAEQEARDAAAALQKKVDEEAWAMGVESVKVDAPVIPKAEKVVRSETGSAASSIKHWVCTIVDPGLVPREYCEPVMKLLNDAVRMGAREIPGCVIEEKVDVRIRA